MPSFLKDATKFHRFLGHYSLIITNTFGNKELALLSNPNGQYFETVYDMLKHGDKHEQEFYKNVQGLKDANPMNGENTETQELIKQINLLVTKGIMNFK